MCSRGSGRAGGRFLKSVTMSSHFNISNSAMRQNKISDMRQSYPSLSFFLDTYYFPKKKKKKLFKKKIHFPNDQADSGYCYMFAMFAFYFMAPYFHILPHCSQYFSYLSPTVGLCYTVYQLSYILNHLLERA